MKNSIVAAFAICALLLACTTPQAQEQAELEELRQEIEQLKTEQAAIRQQLEQLQASTQKDENSRKERPPFKPRELAVGQSATLGLANAPFTVFAYSDYQCPFCERFFRNEFPELNEQLIETGQLRLVLRENPIERIHRQAMPAAKAALCAKDQGRYWPMHELLFSDRKAINAELIQGYATQLELDLSRFESCMNDERVEKRIRADLAEARSMNISGTPIFVLGKTDTQNPDRVYGELHLRGARPASHFKAAMDELSKSNGSEQ